MSKAITIQRNGVDVDMTVDKLRVSRGGSSANWVPESEVRVTNLNAEANGTYVAANAGVYGYNYVTISVPGGSVTGRGSDGKDHTITTDVSGHIVDTIVPSEIRVITSPTYVGPYGEGAVLSFDGLSVEAFYADGSSAGVIPFEDLLFPQTNAPYLSGGEGDPLIEMVGTDGQIVGGVPEPFAMSSEVVMKRDDKLMKHSIYVGAKTTASVWTGGNTFWVYASHTPSYGEYHYNMGIYPRVWDYSDLTMPQTYTKNGKTVYYGFGIGTGNWVSPNCLPGGTLHMNGPAPDLAWEMIYGESSNANEGGSRIPVQWTREDGMVLSTSFGITVVPTVMSDD